MKKLLIILVSLFVCAQAHAQFYVGGTFGFTYSNVAGAGGGGFGGFDDFDDFNTGDNGGDDTQSGFSFKFLPELGYHLSTSMAVGVSVGYIKGYAALGSIDITDYKALLSSALSTAADISSDDGGGFSSIRVAPYIRYTLIRKGGFEIFTDGVFGFNFLTEKFSDGKYFSLELALRPGVSFAISDSVKLLAKIGSVGFQHLRDSDGDFKLTRLGLDLDGSNLMLGAAFYF